jgi:hypothetical protein
MKFVLNITFLLSAVGSVSAFAPSHLAASSVISDTVRDKMIDGSSRTENEEREAFATLYERFPKCILFIYW